MKRTFKIKLAGIGLLMLISVTVCAQGQSIEMLFIDRLTSQPIADNPIEIQQVIYCKDGADCVLPILFEGTTDNYGKVYVPEWIFDYYFNIRLEGYPLNGPFRKQKDSTIYVTRYSDGRVESFNYKTTPIVIKVSSRKQESFK